MESDFFSSLSLGKHPDKVVAGRFSLRGHPRHFCAGVSVGNMHLYLDPLACLSLAKSTGPNTFHCREAMTMKFPVKLVAIL